MRIIFKDKTGKVLEDFVIGKDAKRADAFYIKRSSESTISLVDQEFRFLDKKAVEWLMKDVINIDEKDVALVACYDMGTRKQIYMLERPARDKDAVLLEAPADKKIQKFKLEQVIGALSPFKIDDVTDPAAPPAETFFANQPQFEFRLFNGLIYHVYLGAKVSDDSDKHYFKLAVSYKAPDEPDEKEKRDDAKPAEDLAAKAEKLNQELGTWTYIVSKWVFDSFTTKMEDFFEEEKKDDKKTG